ncbi:hypothetical protein [Taibaiella chishuiensis]|nr:hypothetical protein [Taibaiella chishuiensis]
MTSASSVPVGEELIVGGYSTEGGPGGGTFIYIPGASPVPEDEGIHFVKTGGYFKRLYTGVINASWFGAQGDGEDDSAHLQKAIDYCIAHNVNLHLDGNFTIKDSLVIKRKERCYHDYMTISGGGLYSDKEIPLFTVHTTEHVPVSQLIRFREVVFSGIPDVTTYVLDRNKYIRVSFDGCSFVGIRLLTSLYYLQSIYLINCEARNWKGVFLSTVNGCYDIKITHSLFEAGESFADLSAIGNADDPDEVHLVSNVSISNCVIEGLKGFGIKYKNTSSLSASFNYFEQNLGGDILGDGNTVLAQPNRGVSFIGNFHHFVGNNNHYPVTWGATLGGVSLSNNTNTNLNAFTTSVSDVFHANAATFDQDNSATRFGTDKIHFGNVLPSVNGGVVDYRDKIPVGSVIYNTDINTQNAHAGWICTAPGTYSTAQWKPFGTTRPLIENKGVSLDGSENLNQVHESGYYFPVLPGAWLNTGSNFPVQKRGTLRVYYVESAVTEDLVQTYTVIPTDATERTRTFSRTYFGNGAHWTAWKELAINQSGTTTGRPTGNVAGDAYFDTTLGMPVWWNGSTWVAAAPDAGASVKGLVRKAAAVANSAAQAAGTTPTKAEFDALLQELRNLKTALNAAGHIS